MESYCVPRPWRWGKALSASSQERAEPGRSGGCGHYEAGGAGKQVRLHPGSWRRLPGEAPTCGSSLSWIWQSSFRDPEMTASEGVGRWEPSGWSWRLAWRDPGGWTSAEGWVPGQWVHWRWDVTVDCAWTLPLPFLNFLDHIYRAHLYIQSQGSYQPL